MTPKFFLHEIAVYVGSGKTERGEILPFKYGDQVTIEAVFKAGERTERGYWADEPFYRIHGHYLTLESWLQKRQQPDEDARCRFRDQLKPADKSFSEIIRECNTRSPAKQRAT